MKRIILLLFISVIAILSLCRNSKNVFKNEIGKDDSRDPYLSITRTYVDENNDMFSEYFVYDTIRETVNKIIETPYNSQHPLGIMDLYDNKLYYSSRTDVGDQLFSYDIENGSTIQLTHNLWAINYIIPTKNYIHLMAARIPEPDIEGESIPDIQAMCIDKSSNTIEYYRKYDHHLKAQHISYNPSSQNIYAVFLDNDTNDMARAYEAGKNPKDSTKYSPADHIIKEFDEGFKNEIELFKILGKATYTFSKNKNHGLISVSDYYTSGHIENKIIDLDTKEIRDYEELDNITKTRTYSCLDPILDKMYFIGVDSEGLKNVYSYNIDDNSFKIVLGPHPKYDSAINNITLLGK